MGKESDEETGLWWVIWGIGIAFAIQVTYDGLGELFGSRLKIVFGCAIAASILFLLGYYALVLKPKRSR